MDPMDLFVESWIGYAEYLWREIQRPHLHNYVYWLLAVSIFVYMLELLRPWRRFQKKLRQDFWLDGLYMFWNFFIFSLMGFVALSTVLSSLVKAALASWGIDTLAIVDVGGWPVWAQLVSLFLVRDFVHWNVHRLLHRVPWLWEFHKVHHSVREMGFAAHLRYHWMETILYRSLEFVPLSLIGFGIDDFLIVHLVALTIGHLNHANFYLPVGPLRYVINTPQMHIWHHARDLPKHRRFGMNYGISLSLWDWIFRTAHWPGRTDGGRDLELGYAGLEAFPRDFLHQLLYPWRRSPRPLSKSAGAAVH